MRGSSVVVFALCVEGQQDPPVAGLPRPALDQRCGADALSGEALGPGAGHAVYRAPPFQRPWDRWRRSRRGSRAGLSLCAPLPHPQELGNSLDKCKNNENLQQILTNATIMVVSVTASTTQGCVRGAGGAARAPTGPSHGRGRPRGPAGTGVLSHVCVVSVGPGVLGAEAEGRLVPSVCPGHTPLAGMKVS